MALMYTQCILGNFQYGDVHKVQFFMITNASTSKEIWNNYVDIEQKIMQVRLIISLCTWGYNSLGDPIRQHEVWKK